MVKGKSSFLIRAIALGVYALLWAGTAAWAQLPKMQNLFLEMPQEVVPTLGDVERSKIIEAFKKGSEYNPEVHPINNMLGGKVVLHQLTEDYIKLELDSLTEMQMKVLPFKGRNNYVIAFVATSKVKPAQSVIVFFDKQWEKIDAPQLIGPFSSKDFFANPSDYENREVKDALVEIGRLSYTIELNAMNSSLTIRSTIDELDLNPTPQKTLTPLFKKSGIVMEWNKKKGFAKK